jgi:hypothetical protein
MEQIAQNFPLQVRSLSQQRVSEALRMEMSEGDDSGHQPSGDLRSAVRVNGITVPLSGSSQGSVAGPIDGSHAALDIFALVRQLRRDLRVVGRVNSLMPPPPALGEQSQDVKEEGGPLVKLGSILRKAAARRPAGGESEVVRVDVRSGSKGAVHFLNDLSKDKAYEDLDGWAAVTDADGKDNGELQHALLGSSNDMFAQFQQAQQGGGGLPLLRKNLLTLTIVIDPTAASSRGLLALAIQLVDKRQPLRVGVIIVGPAKESELGLGIGRLFLCAKQRQGAAAAYAFLQRISSESQKKGNSKKGEQRDKELAQAYATAINNAAAAALVPPDELEKMTEGALVAEAMVLLTAVNNSRPEGLAECSAGALRMHGFAMRKGMTAPAALLNGILLKMGGKKDQTASKDIGSKGGFSQAVFGRELSQAMMREKRVLGELVSSGGLSAKGNALSAVLKEGGAHARYHPLLVHPQHHWEEGASSGGDQLAAFEKASSAAAAPAAASAAAGAAAGAAASGHTLLYLHHPGTSHQLKSVTLMVADDWSTRVGLELLSAAVAHVQSKKDGKRCRLMVLSMLPSGTAGGATTVAAAAMAVSADGAAHDVEGGGIQARYRFAWAVRTVIAALTESAAGDGAAGDGAAAGDGVALELMQHFLRLLKRTISGSAGDGTATGAGADAVSAALMDAAKAVAGSNDIAQRAMEAIAADATGDFISECTAIAAALGVGPGRALVWANGRRYDYAKEQETAAEGEEEGGGRFTSADFALMEQVERERVSVPILSALGKLKKAAKGRGKRGGKGQKGKKGKKSKKDKKGKKGMKGKKGKGAGDSEEDAGGDVDKGADGDDGGTAGSVGVESIASDTSASGEATAISAREESDRVMMIALAVGGMIRSGRQLLGEEEEAEALVQAAAAEGRTAESVKKQSELWIPPSADVGGGAAGDSGGLLGLVHVDATLDPLSEDAQVAAPLLRLLVEGMGASLRLRLYTKPEIDPDSLPKRFYRMVLGTVGTFGVSAGGGAAAAAGDSSLSAFVAGLTSPSASVARFAGLPTGRVLTLSLHAPSSWDVHTKKTALDIDNIKLDGDGSSSDIHTTTNALDVDYELKGLAIAGRSTVVDQAQQQEDPLIKIALWPAGPAARSPPPPSSSPEAAPPPSAGIVQAVVMGRQAIFPGYFQLQTTPGVWTMKLAHGESSLLYAQTNAGADGAVGVAAAGHRQIVIRDFASLADEQRIELRSREGKGRGGKKGGKKAQDLEAATKSSKDTIHVFSIASGHLYERFLQIMMLSVSKRTSVPVKFWLVGSFLSPAFKDKLPAMAKKFK